jgi:23S rRNA pseudouridine1911/1915/1917 synthase
MTGHYRQGAPDVVPAAGRALVAPAEARGERLDAVLARLLPQHSRTRIGRWIDAGRVSVEGRLGARSERLAGGERIVVLEEHEPDSGVVPEALALPIVHEDDAVIVIAKPPGLVVHPGAGNPRGTLQNALLHHDPSLAQVARAGIVHRLDKDTSGLMVVARTPEAHTELVRQLQARSVSRQYLAVVHGDLARALVVDAPIGRHPIERTRMAVAARGKAARTHVEVVERFGFATLVRCRLETGRTHQIRVHLSSIGHPLVGDPTYGIRRASRAVPTFGRQALHAERLAFVHPGTRRTSEFHAPLPADLEALIRELRAAHAADRVSSGS